MKNAFRLLALLTAGVTLGCTSRAEAAPPLTPAQIVKIGSYLGAHAKFVRLPDSVRGPLNLPGMQLISLTLKERANNAEHMFALLPDGGLLLVVSNADGSSMFRVNSGLALVGSLHMKNWVPAPQPDPEGALSAEWAYWADIAAHTPY